MTAISVIEPEFVLWTETVLLWSFASYGIMADPLKEESSNFGWVAWFWILALRVTLVGCLSYLLVHSVTLVLFLLLATLAQPLFRYCFPLRWVAEFECLWIMGLIVFPLILIEHYQLIPRWTPRILTDARISALCLFGSTLFLVVRGGTYIVRGILRKAGTLPSGKRNNEVQTDLSLPFHGLSGVMSQTPTATSLPSATSPPSSPPPPTPTPAAATPAATAPAATAMPATTIATPTTRSAAGSFPEIAPSEDARDIDDEELNRGRLIGNLERIVLTLVVIAGSYSALAFLIAAKGLVRFEEFEKSRDFTEYFLVGSLSSVLVALCLGLALRYALLTLWPELLGFQMQP